MRHEDRYERRCRERRRSVTRTKSVVNAQSRAGECFGCSRSITGRRKEIDNSHIPPQLDATKKQQSAFFDTWPGFFTACAMVDWPSGPTDHLLSMTHNTKKKIKQLSI